MNVIIEVEDLVGSGEGALQVIVLVNIPDVVCAGKWGNAYGIRNPFIEDDLEWDWWGSEVTVELDLEEISLDQGVNGDTLILRLSESFSGDGQWHLTLLEVEVSGGEDGHDGFGGISSGIKAAVGGWYIIVEVTLGNTIDVGDWSWDVGSYIDDYFTIGEDICFG